jgi:hypothetical protein
MKRSLVCLALAPLLASCLDAQIARTTPATEPDAGAVRDSRRDVERAPEADTAAPMVDARETAADALSTAADTRPPEDASWPDAAPVPINAVTPTQAGQLIITEIMVDTDVVADDFGEWFEVHNPSTTQAYDLKGCTLHDQGNRHPVTVSLVIPPGRFVSLASFDRMSMAGFAPDYSYQGGLKFGNDGDTVGVTCGTTIIDQVDYSRGNFHRRSGRSLSLDPDRISASANDVGTNWCAATTMYNQSSAGNTIVADFGTPGAANPQCP